MTAAELSLKIAESLEPKPLLCPGEMDADISTSGFWVLHEQLAGEWQPRDFINDPAMRDMLQAKLLEEGWAINLWYSHDKILNAVFQKHNLPVIHLIGVSRERLWAEAYARSKGIL